MRRREVLAGLPRRGCIVVLYGSRARRFQKRLNLGGTPRALPSRTTVEPQHLLLLIPAQRRVRSQPRRAVGVGQASVESSLDDLGSQERKRQDRADVALRAALSGIISNLNVHGGRAADVMLAVRHSVQARQLRI